MENRIKIYSFKDLIAWKKARQLVLKIYQITSFFPKEETYVLSSQIKRSAISVASNIAEGFSRKTNKDKIQFYYIALGSLTEIQSQLILALDLNLITKTDFQNLESITVELSKLINSLIKSLK